MVDTADSPGTRRSPADPQGVVSRLKVKPVPKNVTENKNAVRAAAAAVRAGRGGPGGGGPARNL